MTAERLGKRAAENRVKADDRARADYLRRYHGVNWLDPTLYHLVVNTGCLSVEAAVELIIMAHKAWTEAAAANVEE
jgi:cytidylate kinase